MVQKNSFLMPTSPLSKTEGDRTQRKNLRDYNYTLFVLRYGLVGRNGIGKTVLLRCISERHFKLPDHLTCFHVEQVSSVHPCYAICRCFQEVEADSRTALQAVLESDLEREKLLEEEEILTAKLESGEEGVGDLLTKVFEKMELIEADSAPARASIILTGLGFTLEMQEKQTKDFSGGWRMRIA